MDQKENYSNPTKPKLLVNEDNKHVFSKWKKKKNISKYHNTISWYDHNRPLVRKNIKGVNFLVGDQDNIKMRL